MSDVPNKTGASGASWTEGEKIAYLIVLCENEGKVDAKIANAHIPAGRSIVSCKKMLIRLKEKHKNDIEKIRNGHPLGGSPVGGSPASPEKKTPRKRKSKAVNDEADGAGDAAGDEGTPRKKRATPAKRKSATPAAAEEPVKVKEEAVDEMVEESTDEEANVEV